MNLPAGWNSLRSLNFSPITPSIHKMHKKKFLEMLQDSERVFVIFKGVRRYRFKI